MRGVRTEFMKCSMSIGFDINERRKKFIDKISNHSQQFNMNLHFWAVARLRAKKSLQN